jgi:hypothetical protein
VVASTRSTRFSCQSKSSRDNPSEEFIATVSL